MRASLIGLRATVCARTDVENRALLSARRRLGFAVSTGRVIASD
jgi:hypothetical protein